MSVVNIVGLFIIDLVSCIKNTAIKNKNRRHKIININLFPIIYSRVVSCIRHLRLILVRDSVNAERLPDFMIRLPLLECFLYSFTYANYKWKNYSRTRAPKVRSPYKWTKMDLCSVVWIWFTVTVNPGRLVASTRIK